MKWTLRNYFVNMEVSSLGGALSSIIDRDGIEYLWQGDARYWSGQAPVLFPICGSLRDDQAQFQNGGKTAMPRHGIVRKKEFTCDFCGEDRIQFSIKSDEAMLQQFPYRFTLTISYRLSGKTIEVRYTVVNEDEKDMPFFIGGHPGFCCPLLPDESFGEYQIEFEKEENLSVPEAVTKTGLINIGNRKPLLNREKVLPLKHSLFYEDALILDELMSRKVRLCHKSSKRGVEIEFSDFPYLILWSTENDGPFVAIEPWSGLSTCEDEDDVFEHKRNVQIVRPGEMKQLAFTIGIL
ncbi:MAG: aldose 1-epimerase family protein [Clostridium sp.]|nr:aldose 1-epimerase family protein [Clostridium sp.]